MSAISLVEISNDCGYKYGTLVLGCLCYDNTNAGSACGINIQPTSCSTFGSLCASTCAKGNWPGYFYSCYDDPYTTITSTLIYTQTATKTITAAGQTVTGTGTCSSSENSGNPINSSSSTSDAGKSYKQPLLVSLLTLSVVAVNVISHF